MTRDFWAFNLVFSQIEHLISIGMPHGVTALFLFIHVYSTKNIFRSSIIKSPMRHKLWAKITDSETSQYLIYNLECSRTRRFSHLPPVPASSRINLLFPVILVTFTKHVTSRGSHDVIIGSLITFRLLSCSFCRRNIKREFQRHPDDVSLRPSVHSDLCPPWLVRNWTWKLFLWMDSRE